MTTPNCWKPECMSGHCDGVNHVMPPDLNIVQEREDGSQVEPQNGTEYAVRLQAVRYFREHWDSALQLHMFDQQFADWLVGRFRQGVTVFHADLLDEWRILVGLKRK